ncbi:MAG: hypothetical protein IPM61_07160 [Chlorobi bacterium]|nr:hypothetical protein [Chlorobiota bacterium]
MEMLEQRFKQRQVTSKTVPPGDLNPLKDGKNAESMANWGINEALLEE